ncbi:hypothetical protein [Seonamhaeicola marinus]|uniref:Uncharacterized protein n=1 Tax=Seonamhaeicola marinus TaxID=1912246 RepID=A0A5D0J9Q2_9FLAO|nr:hypothetical protein [Seonamhaeicola marinus]TYA92241.1 hypothetical protein FUA24_02070 [Seonamhaeicola marinus]
MKINSFYTVILFFSLLVLAGCRKENMEFIEAPEEETLTKSSTITNLMKNVTSNDGSKDNILDSANCFNINLPIEVTANGTKINVTAKEDYKIVEYIFDESDDDIDELNITYPITLTLSDFTEVTISTPNELASYKTTCKGENVKDDDIECLDFNYPITGSIANTISGNLDNISFSTDEELFQFLENLNNTDLVALNFPISVTLFDNTQINIFNFIDLARVISMYKDSCDEDDDFNYNDDDCDDCNVTELADILTTCNSWTVDKLKRYGNDLDDVYDGYTFNFYSNGNLGVYWGGTSAYGTWVASGEGNNITVTINVPGLDYCNADWRLHEIAEYTENKIDLRVGYNNRLRYNNVCE